jgi:heme-degrading monooxygenase HmoA
LQRGLTGEILARPGRQLRKEDAMHARVSTYTGEADALLDGFQAATEPLEKIEGFSHAYFLLDRVNNRGMSITIWESEDALLASAARADELRKGATEPSGSTIDSVEQYEIALTAGAKRAAVGS